MLNKPFLKKMLLTNKFRVYSMIVNSYYEELEDLKLSFFREWLANELDIDVEKINPASLNSALARHRNRLKKQGKNISVPQTNKEVKSVSFKFSKDDEPPKENIIEL